MSLDLRDDGDAKTNPDMWKGGTRVMVRVTEETRVGSQLWHTLVGLASSLTIEAIPFERCPVALFGKEDARCELEKGHDDFHPRDVHWEFRSSQHRVGKIYWVVSE